MPYIKPEKREVYDELVESLGFEVGTDYERDVAGLCNYIITTFLLRVYDQKESLSYRDYNEIIGLLECAKLEFYRRQVSQYEDKKIEENGDVYE